MTKITRWNPYREMMTLRDAMDRLVDRDALGPQWRSPRTWGLALDVAESEDEYLVKASLPGINPDDLDITLEDDVLTIKGVVQESKEVEETTYHLRERRSGNFCRSLRLPTKVSAEDIGALYEAGVLTLHLPKAEDAKPRRIEVKSVDTPVIVDEN